MQDIIKIVRNSYLVMFSALGILIGAGMVVYGTISAPPTRESLQVVEGTITEASRVTRKKRRSGATTSYYEMTLKPKAGSADLKLRVPTIEMAETDVRSLLGRPVKAEFDSEQDVYVLSSGNREVLTYTNSLERRNLNFRQYHVDGIALMLGSGFFMVIGLLLGYRRHRKEVAAGNAAAQQ